MESKKNNKLLLVVVGIFSGLLLLIISLFIYFRSTPQYSLLQIRNATQERDYSKFEKYVDVNSIVDNVFTEALKDTKSEDAGMFAGLLSGIVESTKNTAKAGFKTSVENGESADSLYSEMTFLNLLTKLEVEKHGKTADVKFKIDEKEFSCTMRNENGLWRVFKINNLDSLAEKKTEQPTSTIDKALKEEVTLSTITIKVNKVEKLSKIPSSWGDATKPSNSENLFLKVNVTIKNLSNDDISVGSDMLVIADSQSNQYEMQSLVFIEDKSQLYYESIKPNLAKTGNVYFEIPKTATGLYLPITHKDTGDLYKISLGL